MSRAARVDETPAPTFAALGDPTRLALLERLADGRPRSITQLADGLEPTRQAVTKHLRVLERAGIVRSSRVGRETRFVVESGSLRAARSYLDTVSRQWDAAIGRLKLFVESESGGVS